MSNLGAYPKELLKGEDELRQILSDSSKSAVGLTAGSRIGYSEAIGEYKEAEASDGQVFIDATLTKTKEDSDKAVAELQDSTAKLKQLLANPLASDFEDKLSDVLGVQEEQAVQEEKSGDGTFKSVKLKQNQEKSFDSNSFKNAKTKQSQEESSVSSTFKNVKTEQVQEESRIDKEIRNLRTVIRDLNERYEKQGQIMEMLTAVSENDKRLIEELKASNAALLKQLKESQARQVELESQLKQLETFQMQQREFKQVNNTMTDQTQNKYTEMVFNESVADGSKGGFFTRAGSKMDKAAGSLADRLGYSQNSKYDAMRQGLDHLLNGK